MKTKVVKLKAYLEGYQIPITSINIREQIGAAPVAVINLPALPEFTKLLPRTLIHVFYSEFLEDDDSSENFYLIFEGELSGINFGRTQSGAGVQLTFTGLTSNWKNTYKAIVDFSLDTFSMSRFLLIGGEAKSGNRKYSFSDDRTKADEELDKRASWLFGGIPGTTITSKIQQNLDAFFKTGGSDGLEKTIKSLVGDLTKSNPYYKLIDNLYKIGERIKVLENDELKETLKGMIVSELITQNFSTMSSTMDGSSLLKYILSKLEYFYVEPSAPTNNSGTPNSIFFTPDTSFMMPLKCNVFYPDQIISSNFSKNFLGEPTRLVATSPTIGLSNAPTGKAYAMSPRFVAPQNKSIGQIEKVSTNDMTAGFEGMPAMTMSDDELLRGINPQIYNYNDAQLAYASFIRDGKSLSEVKKDLDPSEVIEKVQNEDKGPTKYIKAVNNYEYYKRFYSARSFSFDTTYSPYRLIGFPGVVLDDKLPSIVGKIVSISSNISVTGSCSSSVVMENTRDYEKFSASPDNIDGFKDGTYSKYKDIWPDVGFWIDPDKYSPSTVGSTFKNVVKPGDDTYIATIDDYAISELKNISGEWSSDDMVNLVGGALNRLIEKRSWYSDPHLFADREIVRALVKEDDFWNFFLDKNSEDSITDSKFSRSIKKMTYEVKTRIIQDKDTGADMSDSKKPFVLERQEIVKKILDIMRGNM